MALVKGNIGVQVLEALGLPSANCLSLSLTFEPNSVVVARADYLTDDAALHEVVNIVRTLKAVEG